MISPTSLHRRIMLMTCTFAVAAALMLALPTMSVHADDAHPRAQLGYLLK